MLELNFCFCLYLGQYAEEILSPYLFYLFVGVAAFHEAHREVDHVVIAVDAEEAASAVKVHADADVVNASHFDTVVYVVEHCVDVGLMYVVALKIPESIDLYDTTLLGECLQHVVGDVAVVVPESTCATMRADDGGCAQFDAVPERLVAGV